MPSTIVIGAGWAGLACAYELTKAGHQVTLIEAAPQTGGRARGVPFNQYTVDNGQHICLGAYHTLRQIIKELKLNETELFNILPLNLIMHGAHKLQLKLPRLPAPYHLLAGLLTAKNIPWRIKYQTLKFGRQLHKINFKLQQDCTVLDLLQNYHQSEFIIQHLWEPIALATMTTPIKHASAQVFLNILRLSFTKQHTDSNWYLPAVDLSSILPKHIEHYLRQHGRQIIYAQAIKQLHITDRFCTGISSHTKTWQADNIVLAIPPWQVLGLLGDYAYLAKFTYQPIITIYFEFTTAVNLPYPLIGMVGTTSQWVFDRRFADQPNLISVIISGPGAHQELDQTTLANTVFTELKTCFPELPSPIAQRVINEKRAAFTCDVAIQKYRPQAKTNLANLWLSGDYLATGLPATLEGALLSGKRTAEWILAMDS